MTAPPSQAAPQIRARVFPFPHRHFLSAGDLDPPTALGLLDLADAFAAFGREREKKLDLLRGRLVVTFFFEASTRTQASFEIAAKRLGADTVNVGPRGSSMAKGESLADTVATLSAMRPDMLIVRHAAAGAAAFLASGTDAAVINAGDGAHEHPTQALLDTLALRRAFGRVDGLRVAICGDILHSRVARSNVALLTLLGTEVRLVGPPTLMPAGVERWGAAVHHDLDAGIAGADAVMMLRLQRERMDGALIPSPREYARFWGLTRERLAGAAAGVRVLHPGPMNRGVEIASELADDPAVSLIADQVEMGVAARMAVLASLAERRDNR